MRHTSSTTVPHTTRSDRAARATSRTVLRTAFAAALLGITAACSDDPAAPPSAADIDPVGSSAITGVAGENASAPLVVRVTSSGGSPVANTPVTFTIVDGGGSVSPTTDTTDAQGNASTTWRLGGTAGTQRAQAQVSGVNTVVTFTATVAPAVAASIAANAGNNQTAVAGQQVTTAPSVVVRDRFNNPVPGVTVLFSVTSGGGSVGTVGATTDANGVATATNWRLGTTAGTNQLTAVALVNGAAGNPVTFTATGTAGAATTIGAANTQTVTANVGALVTPAPSVRLTDAAGNPVANATVTFTGSAGSNVVGGTRTTDANGVATVEAWQLGTTAGTYTLTVASGNLTPITFSATARPVAASAVAIAAGNAQTSISGRPVDVEPSVRVTDSFGNPVSGIEVVFDVISGGGFAVGRRPVTNAQGIATVGGWTLGETPGPNSLRATVNAPGIANGTVTFTATGTPGAPANASVQSGNSQSAPAGTAVATPPSVLVRDSRGNPVPGVTVNFIVTGGGGTVTGSTATTNAQGVATAASWTLGTTAGTQTVVARIAGLPDVVFTATATAGAAAQIIPLTQQAIGQVGVNQFVTPLPSVRVVDAVGNPVSGATVNFTVVTGNATLTTATVTTGANGIATLGNWRAGTVAGVTTNIRATVQGVDLTGAEPEFTVTTIPAVGSQLNAAAGSQLVQTGTASAPVSNLPSVRLTDSFGNPVANQAIEFFTSTGTVTGGLVTTDANGVATVTSWTLPAGSGARTLTARVVNNPTLTVTFTANVP